MFPKKLSKSPQNPAKIHPKSIRNLKNSSKIVPKITPKSQTPSKSSPRPFFFSIFCNFLKPRGLPKSSKNQNNPKKNAQKSASKKDILLNTIFIDFSSFWLPKMNPKSTFFEIFCENDDFAKINENH